MSDGSTASPDDHLGLSAAELDAVTALLAYREREEIAAEAAVADLSTVTVAADLPQAAIEAAARVSDRAFQLIVNYETGGKPYYERVIKSRPIWPKASSGITIGFGYDLGYVGLDEYRRDWAALIAKLTPQQRHALDACVGHHSGKDSAQTMQALLASVTDVIASWSDSEVVFKAKTLPKFALMTEKALPNCKSLNGDCFGVLVSLTFNRGASYGLAHDPAKDPRDRYREMRAIKAAMVAKSFADIAGQIKAMVRIWAGTDIETGMKRRRSDEADLFIAGLGSGLPAPAIAAIEVTEASVDARSGDDDVWEDVTDDDIANAAIAGTMVTAAAAGAKWAADNVQPDYAHLGSNLPTGLAFSLTSDDLALLVTLNDFDVAAAGDTPILFGLRGAGIVKDHTNPQGIVLVDQRPDHILPRCVIGVWSRTAKKVSVFPASTVPNQAAVALYFNTRSAGNLLPTGYYGYVCGAHTTKNRSTPGCFVLRNADMSHRIALVRRSIDDLVYEKSDMVDRCGPGDNIHPTFFSQPTGFSSLGCQTVVGSFKNGAHAGPWADFRKAVGFTEPAGNPGKPFNYMLLTGAEARLASGLRKDGLASDKIAQRRLRRLRAGSHSDAVKILQQRLNLPSPDGTFSPATGEALHRLQKGLPGSNGSDGIFSPDLNDTQGWQVFSEIGV
ncbi:peptidoglycan-binding protein [Bradyrhizobium prioriisuperbiae]|uniref:peptidoglycan-binding protein n=1 Tax=Bradyrhizobium prioriisuperbiae TaxID=2854389 RepID=UPI0028F0FF17|nr:peptidoglycan-binding protein [Bradyrhizobium prioritasuperba]